MLAKFPDGIIPGLQVHTRMSGTFSTTDLDGAWHGCDFQYGVNLDVFLSGAGAWSFDNVGNYTMQGVTNLDGNATNPYDWGGGTFTVASEGQVQCTRPDGQKTLGQLSPDKRFLALSGAMADNDDPKLHILVRQADGTLTAVSAQGIYRALCLFYSPTRDDFASAGGRRSSTVYEDYTLELDLNWSAGSTATLAVSGTYAVAGNGRVTITESNAGAAQYQGGLAQDGRYAVLGGGVSDGSNPAIFFLLK